MCSLRIPTGHFLEDIFSPRIGAILSDRIGEHATADRIADVVVGLCQEIERVLAPIIGSGGVGALYQRSLHLVRATHEWIDISPAGPTPVADFSALRVLLEQQSPDVALAGGTAVLETFSRLLVSLIGFSLSDQLLAAVWLRPNTDSSVQDAP